MNVMEKLRALFQGANIPEETRHAFDGAGSPAETIKRLYAVRARNEIEMREYEDQLLAIDKTAAEDEARLKSQDLSAIAQTTVLRRIERLRKQQTMLGEQITVINDNINLTEDLIGRVKTIESTRLSGLTEAQIDGLDEQRDDAVAAWRRTQMAGAEAARPALDKERQEEAARLADLKRQILGSSPAPERAAGPKPELE
jgi:hypothetical protein